MEQKQIQGRYHFEAARYVCVAVWNSAGNKLRQPYRTLQDFMQFPWEQQKRISGKQTPEQMREILMALASSQNKRQKSDGKKNK